MVREFGAVKISTESEEALAFKTLFHFNNRLQQSQVFTEISHRMRVPLTVMGVIRRLYEDDYIDGEDGKKIHTSKRNFQMLGTFQEEFNINGLPIDRKSLLEGAEIVAAVRSKRGDDED